ncbi:MAG TPA: glycosyl hydrolase [Caulobacteraceae bacterium]|nr:glycosyl hydrolase [Caulobacteraceae bacterium]
MARTDLLIGTRKGAWVLSSNGRAGEWRLQGPEFLGQIVSHFVQDPRDPSVRLIAAATGHLGPTVFRSKDAGASWTEARIPPAFPRAADEAKARSVDHTFWLEPGHASEPGVWWAGASPPGLFVSDDHGETWTSVDGFNEHPMYDKWVPADSGTPDGPLLNQVVIDPRDAAHMYVATSTGGVFESRDRARTWAPLNKGVEANFMPDPYPEYGQDAHYIALSPTKPDRIYQQNHCGIYRVDRPEDTWTRIGRAMPEEIGDIGFTIVPHPRDADCAWVFPMDGADVWPRVSPGGRPAVYRTDDAGQSWRRQDQGFPHEQGWFTVKRQAFCADTADPVGLYLGTTGGEVWTSGDEGERWRSIAAHLPEIYSVVAASG